MDCQHGQLARSCELCIVETEVAELRAEVERLEKENAKLREALEKIATCAPEIIPREWPKLLAQQTLRDIETLKDKE